MDIFGPSDEIFQREHAGYVGADIPIDELQIHCISTPYHTSAHLSFHTRSGSIGISFYRRLPLLCWLWKIFESTASQMHSLSIRSQRCRPNSGFPGHEYTLSNLKFAESVDPENKEISDFRRDVTRLWKWAPFHSQLLAGEARESFMRVREHLYARRSRREPLKSRSRGEGRR